MKYIILSGFIFICLQPFASGPGSYWLSALLQKAPDIVLFHNNHFKEKWKPGLKKTDFFYISAASGQPVLKKFKPVFEVVEDDCIGAKITYCRIPGNFDPMIPVFSSSVLTEKSRLINAEYDSNKLVNLSDKIGMRFKNERYTLRVQKNGQLSDSADLLIQTGLHVMKLGKTNLDTEFPVTLIYAGDITGDMRIDLILQLNTSRGIYWILYTAEMKAGNDLQFKEANRCLFTALPC